MLIFNENFWSENINLSSFSLRVFLFFLLLVWSFCIFSSWCCFIWVKYVSFVAHSVIWSAISTLTTKYVEGYDRYGLTVVAEYVHSSISILFWHYSFSKLFIIVFFHEALVEERFPTNWAIDLHSCVLFVAVLVHIMITFHEVDRLPARVQVIEANRTVLL